MQQKIPLAFVLAMNQDLCPGAQQAIDVCYLPLLEAFESHPQIGLGLEISGGLLAWAAWHRPRMIDLIQRMIERGQAEILGTSLARNILYCSEPASLEDSLRFYREQIAARFDFSPGGFLNPGKIWSHEYIPQLAKAGYLWTLVDRHVLEASGVKNEVFSPRLGVFEDQSLILLTDSLSLSTTIFETIEDFSPAGYEALIEYLGELARENPTGILTYSGHAETSGLWQDPAQTEIIANWGRFLSRLAQDPRVETPRISDWLETHLINERLESSVDGQPEWILEAFKTPETRWHQAGYQDWFDFAANSPGLAYFNRLYQDLSRRIKETETLLEATRLPASLSASVETLLRDARFGLALHQYELGFAETSLKDFSRRELARVAAVRLSLIDAILADRVGFSVFDVNDDGISEIVWLDKDNYFVFSRYGGRLLYWIDLKTGREIIGCEHPAGDDEPYRDDNRLPQNVARGFSLRRRGLNDTLTIKDPSGEEGSIALSEIELPFILKESQIEFHYLGPEVRLVKRISILKDGLLAEWYLESESEVRLKSETAFSPQHEDILREAKSSDFYRRAKTSLQTPLFEVGIEAANLKSSEQAFAIGFEFESDFKETPLCRLRKILSIF